MFDQKSTGTERQQFLKTILHADEQDEEEENEVPDDETVNQMLSRGEGEFELYQRMDIERRREEARLGQARKPRLMEEGELPEWMSVEEDEVERLTAEEEPEGPTGRGNRQKKDVDYGDSLTEKEWLKAIGAMEEEGNAQDDDDDDEEEVSTGVRKRGRPSGSSGRGRKRADGDAGDDDDEPSTKKRRGPRSLNFDKMGGSSGAVSSQVKRKMKKILDVVLKYTDAEGRILSQPFMKLPTRKELPDYYEVIKKPIDIYKIFQRIRADKYMELEDLERDFIQLCKNAQNYNEESSLIYEDSVVLQSVFTSARQRVEAEPDEPAATEEASNNGGGGGGGEEEDMGASESDDNSNMASSSAVKMKIKIGRGRGGGGVGRGGKRKRSGRKYVSDDDDDFGEDEEGASERTSSRSSSRVASPAPSRRTR